MAWRDRKRHLWLLALLMPCLPFAAVLLFRATGGGIWLWLGPIVILGIVPIIDVLTGRDSSNPPDDVIGRLEADRYYRWITYLFLPIQYAGFVFAFWVIATGDLTVLEKVGLSVTVGFIAGLGINTAHELGHKRESHERWLAKIALAQSLYGHFSIEHNRGHHVRVATPEDPASSRVAESFYVFWPRTVLGSVRSAWRIEVKRYAARNQRPYRWGNDVLNAWLISAVLWVTMMLWLGAGIVPYLVIQAVVGFTLLEAVNYLEHYGMLRQRVGSGDRERYVRVEPRHSWNSNNVATNVLLYHLQRHSDHHANPTRRYQSLRDYEEAPQLPAGYASMILLALVPPLWRRVMDAKVLAHYGGDMSLANIRPSKRAKLLARYPAVASHHEGSPPDVPGAEAVDTGAPAVVAARGGRCPVCGYTYVTATGAPREGFPAGTPWSSVPDTWVCPDCGVREKSDFVAIDTAST